MSTPPALVDWSSRPVVSALSADRLAALVDRSIARAEELLFTATPTQELEEIGRWQRLRDLAFAGQVRAVVAAWNRAGSVREFVGCEVGLAIGSTSTTGGNLVELAVSIGALPGLLEAVEDGLLTEGHVRAVVRELDRVALSLEQRQAVVLIALARFRGQAPGQLAQVVARLIVTVDQAAAAARDAVAAKDRRVWFSRDVDGQAVVSARGPAAQIAAIRAALDATLPEHPGDGDDRSRGAREFDLLVDLLTGSTVPGSWTAEVLVPFSVAEGGDLELAEIPGLGLILPSTARDLLEQASTAGTVHQSAVDETGAVIAVSDPLRPTTHERPPPTKTWTMAFWTGPPVPARSRGTCSAPAGSSCSSSCGAARCCATSAPRPTRSAAACGACSKPATVPACSPAAADPPGAPTKTTASPGPPARPAPTTSPAYADTTTAPNTPSSPSPATPTAPTPGPPAAAGSSIDNPRATKPRPRHRKVFVNNC